MIRVLPELSVLLGGIDRISGRFSASSIQHLVCGHTKGAKPHLSLIVYLWVFDLIVVTLDSDIAPIILPLIVCIQIRHN